MIISNTKTPANRPQNHPNFQGDIVPQENCDFANPRTWEVAETKGREKPFSGHGTWEDAEKKAVVENVRNRNFQGDKLPL